MQWIFLLIAGLLTPTAAFAQAKAFQGVSFIAGGVLSKGLSASDVRYDYTNLFAGSVAPPGFATGDSYSLNRDDELHVMPVVGVGYTLALGEKVTLGLAGAADFVRPKWTMKSGSETFANPTGVADNPRGYVMSTIVDPEIHWSVSIEPGYAVMDRLLAFLRFSFHQLRADLSTRSTVSTAGLAGPVALTNPSSHATFNGFGIGAGGRYLLTKHAFIESSVEWTKFESKRVPAPGLTSTGDEITIRQAQYVKPEWVDFRVAVGFRF